MGTWNYRVLAHEHKDEIYFKMHSVYYDDDGKPGSYSNEPATIGGEDLDEVKADLVYMTIAATRPIFWYGDKFPEEYEKAV